MASDCFCLKQFDGPATGAADNRRVNTAFSTVTSELPEQPRNPLHGITLEAMLEALVAHYGWPELADRIPVRCFQFEPSVPSSLRFLRKTAWAREKVEGLYLFMLRDRRRNRNTQPPAMGSA